ncbi:MAG: hypothetical protein IPG40_00010 [Zoogloea sp.]|nr:hypothetical protein [Zoogloea sp.]
MSARPRHAVDNPVERHTLIELLGQWRMAPPTRPACENTCLRGAFTQAASNNLPYRVVVLTAPSHRLRRLLPGGHDHQAQTCRSPAWSCWRSRAAVATARAAAKLGIAAYLPMPVEASDLLQRHSLVGGPHR